MSDGISDGYRAKQSLPCYINGCSSCVFLGCATDESGHPHDLYACANTPTVATLGPSVIARYGNGGYEYISMPWNAALITDELHVMLFKAFNAVGGKVTKVSRERFKKITDMYLQKIATPHILQNLAAEVTHEMRNPDRFRAGLHDAAWQQVLDSLYFHADVDNTGNVILTPRGGQWPKSTG